MSSTVSLAFRRDKSLPYLPAGVPPGLEVAHTPRYHPAPSRNEIAIVQPVLVCPFLPSVCVTFSDEESSRSALDKTYRL